MTADSSASFIKVRMNDSPSEQWGLVVPGWTIRTAGLRRTQPGFDGRE